MAKRICMFLFNPFTNDARVLRECTALAEAGFEVDLYALQSHSNKNLPKREQRKEGFQVIRVSDVLPEPLSSLFNIGQSIKGFVFKNSLMKILSALPILVLLIINPILTILFVIYLVCSSSHKIRLSLDRGYSILLLTLKGFSKKYDIYHANDLNTLPQAVINAKLFRNKKLVYDSHEIQTSRTGYNSRFIGIIEKFLIKFIDVFIHENHTRAKYIQEQYGIYPEVLHNYPFIVEDSETVGINLHETLSLPKDEPILLYQGGMQPGRGLEQIIEAVPLINKGTVVFIGDGKSKPKLIEMVKVKKLHDRVKFISKVPVEDLLKYTRNGYLGFQVLNNTNFNHYSASSNKLFEYIMCGVPVIACSFPEIKKIVEGENIGICVDSHISSSIADGVNQLVSNKEIRDKMSENCLNARMKYNWEVEKRHLITLYKKLNIT
ncbi:glycosyltransferase [Gottfriedia acidiceleris]|uniref:glycosyltransferase n=1 Tax=Gottfriedia acidiceleris TaxID=371036 RepID=UPI0033975611